MGASHKRFRNHHRFVDHRFDYSFRLRLGNSSATGRADEPCKGPTLALSSDTLSGDGTGFCRCLAQCLRVRFHAGGWPSAVAGNMDHRASVDGLFHVKQDRSGPSLGCAPTRVVAPTVEADSNAECRYR